MRILLQYTVTATIILISAYSVAHAQSYSALDLVGTWEQGNWEIHDTWLYESEVRGQHEIVLKNARRDGEGTFHSEHIDLSIDGADISGRYRWQQDNTFTCTEEYSVSGRIGQNGTVLYLTGNAPGTCWATTGPGWPGLPARTVHMTFRRR